MRKFHFLFFLFISFTFFSSAQNDEDALRYSRNELNGTARFRGMAGAMGAMGADMSCLNNNPAGLGVYKKSDLSVTFGFQFAKAKTNYNDSLVKDFRNGFALPNFGIAGAGVDKAAADKKHYTRSNFAIAVNRNVNFKNNISIAGNSKGSTMGLAFSAAAQGKGPHSLDQFYELMPYNFDIIDKTPSDSTAYISIIPQEANNRQEMTIIEGGGLTEIAMGGGYTYDDKIYGGWSLSVPIINFNRSALYTENCIEKQYYSPAYQYNISSFSFQEDLRTTGTGINIKLGMIYRFSQYVRAGFAYHSPSIYAMKDFYRSFCTVNFQNGPVYSDSSAKGAFKYTLITPQKLQAAISVLLYKAMAMNFELESVNYASMKLKSTPDYFGQVNKYIRQNYTQSVNMKAGAELNTKPIIYRAGYAMYGSADGKIFTGDSRHHFSLGAGYKWKNSFIDVNYSIGFRAAKYYMYNPLYVKAAEQKFSRAFLLFTFGTKV